MVQRRIRAGVSHGGGCTEPRQSAWREEHGRPRRLATLRTGGWCTRAPRVPPPPSWAAPPNAPSSRCVSPSVQLLKQYGSGEGRRCRPREECSRNALVHFSRPGLRPGGPARDAAASHCRSVSPGTGTSSRWPAASPRSRPPRRVPPSSRSRCAPRWGHAFYCVTPKGIQRSSRRLRLCRG